MKHYSIIGLLALVATLVVHGDDESKLWYTPPPPGKVYYQVLDTEGNPVEGAVVILGCSEQLSYPVDRRYVSDSSGRIVVEARNSMWYWEYRVRSIKKRGYDGWSSYLNPHMGDSLTSEKSSADRPFILRLRKFHPEPEVLFWTRVPGSVKADGTGKVPPVAFSILQDSKGTEHDGYVDFFAQPRCDTQKREWSLSLWTTNANAGIIATTNRVYVAPESGYASRVEVPQRDLLQESFTVYLKTRPQRLYARLSFAHNDIKMQYCERWQDFSFSCSAAINPYGGRILEEDYRLRSFNDATDLPGVRQTLLDGKYYAQRPDVPARVENRRREYLLRKEWLKLKDEDNRLSWRIEDMERLMAGRPKEEVRKRIKPIVDEWEEVDRKMKNLGGRRIKYDKELPTLNLPPGVTEKQKYGKVDLELVGPRIDAP